VQVHRVRLIYEGGALKPRDSKALERAVNAAQDKVKEVGVLFE
jgi:hypothetical protein